MPPTTPLLPAAERAAAARHFVILMGTVSAFGDATYEGARALLGPWLAALGARASIVGAVAGACELASQAPRLLTGPLADAQGGRWRWILTLWGYSVNLWAVPALALAHSWHAAAALFLIERFGKALRSPARSALVSHAAKCMGVGLGFAVDQLLDTTGSVVGSIATAGVLAATHRAKSDTLRPYRWAFALLLVPAVANVGLALYAAWRVPRPEVTFGESPNGGDEGGENADPPPVAASTTHRTPAYAALAAGATLTAAGVIDFALIAYSVTAENGNGGANAHHTLTRVPLLYALANAVGAVSALLGGMAFDRVGGSIVLALAAAASAAVGPLVFLVPRATGSHAARLVALVAGVMLFGASDGARTSATKAAIAQAVPSATRGAAFGELAALSGAAWWLGSTALGVLYQHHSAMALVILSACLQMAAIPCFLVTGV